MASGGATESMDRIRTLMSRPLERNQAMRIPAKALSRPSFIASDEIIQGWYELALRVHASPYLRPGWVEAWWLAFGKGDLKIMTLYRKGRLAALLPMADYRGVLRSVSNYHSPRAGILAEDLPAAMELATSLYAEQPRRVSLSSLDPAGSSIKACRWAAETAGYKVAVRPYQRSPYLDIAGDWEGYESGLSKNLLIDLRRARMRLARHGQVSIDMVTGREFADGPLKEAFTVEAAGWKGLRGSAILSNPNTRNFYTNIARWAASHGMLRLFFLRLGKRPIAMYYALEDKGTCYLLKGGYDSAYRRYSPGKLLLHAIVSHCFSAGLSRIEFHGDAEPYKFLWADSVNEQKRLEAFLPTTAGRLRWAAIAYMRPAAKRMLGHFGLSKPFRE